MSKFMEATRSAKPDDDAQDLLSTIFAPTPLPPKPPSDDPGPLSKRATKRVSARLYPFNLVFCHTFTTLTDTCQPDYRLPSSRR